MTQDRSAIGRAYITHPVSVLSQHRHHVRLALIVGDDGKGDGPAGPPALDFERDEPARPETGGSQARPGPVHQARQMVRAVPPVQPPIETMRHFGLTSVLDPGDYPTGVAISKERFAALPLEHHAVHGAWNYTLHPAAGAPSAGEGTTGQRSSPAHRRQEMLRKLNDERLTGMTSAGLASLCAALAPLQAARAQQRYSEQRDGRARRAAGKLRGKPLFDDPARVLLTLLYQRQACSMSVLVDLLEVTAVCIADLVRGNPGSPRGPRPRHRHGGRPLSHRTGTSCVPRPRRPPGAGTDHRTALPSGADQAQPPRPARPHQAARTAASRPGRAPRLPAARRPPPAQRPRRRLPLEDQQR